MVALVGIIAGSGIFTSRIRTPAERLFMINTEEMILKLTGKLLKKIRYDVDTAIIE
jgi:hypothetical protein